jgi:hypothetical protein
MKKLAFQWLACALVLCPLLAHGKESAAFSFGVIAQSVPSDVRENALRQAIAESDADNLAFVVANGIKAANEPCTDAVYKKHQALLDSAKNGLVISLMADDWTACRDENNRPIAFESINRLRELFFADEFSLGDSKIPLIRQSTMPKFRNYAENMRWRINDVLFATINVPANNNNYVYAAGRNSEFEDREIANNDWLQRIFLTARIKKLDGIVLFCDANPFISGNSTRTSNKKRGGYIDIRRKILALSNQFHGRVLIVHNESEPGQASGTRGIIWHHNIGTLHTGAPWRKVTVQPSSSELFTMTPVITAQTAPQ